MTKHVVTIVYKYDDETGETDIKTSGNENTEPCSKEELAKYGLTPDIGRDLIAGHGCIAVGHLAYSPGVHSEDPGLCYYKWGKYV